MERTRTMGKAAPFNQATSWFGIVR